MFTAIVDGGAAADAALVQLQSDLAMVMLMKYHFITASQCTYYIIIVSYSSTSSMSLFQKIFNEIVARERDGFCDEQR